MTAATITAAGQLARLLVGACPRDVARVLRIVGDAAQERDRGVYLILLDAQFACEQLADERASAPASIIEECA